MNTIHHSVNVGVFTDFGFGLGNERTSFFLDRMIPVRIFCTEPELTDNFVTFDI